MVMGDQAQNIKFVQEVEKFPCLYNYKLPEYSRKDVVENNWNRVGEKLNMSGTACKRKWKNLRAVLARHLKTYKTGSATRAKKPYYLTNLMKFVLPYIKVHIQEPDDLSPAPLEYNDYSQELLESSAEKKEETESLISPTAVDRTNIRKDNYREDSTYSEDTTSVHYSSSKRKKNLSDDNNPRKMFMLSLLPEINEMTEPQMRLFKRKILGLIDEITTEKTEEIPHSQISSVKSSPKSYTYNSDC